MHYEATIGRSFYFQSQTRDFWLQRYHTDFIQCIISKKFIQVHAAFNWEGNRHVGHAWNEAYSDWASNPNAEIYIVSLVSVGKDVFVILHKVCANSRSCEKVPYGRSQNMLVLQLFVLWTCIAFVLGFSRCVGNGCAGGIVPPGVAANLTCCEQQKACVCMKFMTIRYVGLPCSGQPSERWLFENTFDSPCSLIWT